MTGDKQDRGQARERTGKREYKLDSGQAGQRTEFQRRLSIFSENLRKARLLQMEEGGTAQYGVTKFSDLTDEEFSHYLMVPSSFESLPPLKNVTSTNVAYPNSCDWRKKGVISAVKNQGGNCKSCWAFATVGNIEAQYGILGHPKNLSVQQLIDCYKHGNGNGCQGGTIPDAFRTVLEIGGLTSESKYPYIGKMRTCQKNMKPEEPIETFTPIPRNEDAMASHVAQSGTLVVLINSSPLKNYKKEIITLNAASCNPNKVDHAVLIVGYGKDGTIPYWILKNSWGANWGMGGFFLLYRGNNTCGITKSAPMTAIVKTTNRKNGAVSNKLPQTVP
ncbi:cathepsin W-like [Discoglossus pictus]